MKASQAQLKAVNWYRKFTERGKRCRYLNRRSYYKRTQHLTSGRRRWSSAEMELLSTYEGSDEELAYLIKRSVGAIQSQRYRLNKEVVAHDQSTNLN